MAVWTIKLPDVGEGVAEAELVEWTVAPGDLVREDQIIAAVMTDKATVEIPCDVTGTVVWLGGAIGETLAVGSDLVRIETESRLAESAKPVAGPAAALEVADNDEHQLPPAVAPVKAPPVAMPPKQAVFRPPASAVQRPLASPSVRNRARQAGVDLRTVRGTAPAGRISHADLDAYLSGGGAPSGQVAPVGDTVRHVPVTGLRRKIAQRLANAARRIPHITIIEEVDVTMLEELREKLNSGRGADRAKLTLLPFLMAAIVKAVKDQPALNAHFDDEADVIAEHSEVHIGIATQTGGGLMVPVVRHCETLSIWDAAAEVLRVSNAARAGTASRDELSGSTITISSLGPLGAVATTPIINHPEVAIVGVNKIAVRPVWNGSEFLPRKMMNLSSSFDHRVIDGWDAALFVQRLKTLLETPALIFVEM